MSQEDALVPIEQKTVLFNDDEVVAVRTADGTIYVPIRPLCDQLGVDWSAQRRRINRDPVLVKKVMSVAITARDIDASSRQPRSSTVLALPLDYLNGWLFGINAQRVKPELKERLIQYQEDCYQVLAEAFGYGRVTAAPDPLINELLKTDSPAAQAYKMVMAMAQMARQQLLHEHRLDEHERRLQLLEAGAGDASRYITNAQASRISQAVKAIAMELGKRSGRNEFGGVYGELYRRFDIAGYRELPAAKYDEAMHFLRSWFTGVADTSDVPF